MLHLKGGGSTRKAKQIADIHPIYPETGHLASEILQNELTSQLGSAKHQPQQLTLFKFAILLK